MGGLYGTCDCPFPTALRAEKKAVIVMLQHAIPALIIHVDCKTVVDGWTKGKSWCTASSRPDADMWAELWRLREDVGPGVELRKCKEHATDLDVPHGICSQSEKDGNEHADHYAGAGVDIAIHQSPNERFILDYKEARRWYRWLATLAADLPADTQPIEKQKKVPGAGRPRIPANEARHAAEPHVVSLLERQRPAVGRFLPRRAKDLSRARPWRVWPAESSTG